MLNILNRLQMARITIDQMTVDCQDEDVKDHLAQASIYLSQALASIRTAMVVLEDSR